MPPSRSFGTSAWKSFAVAIASPSAVWRSASSTPSHLPIISMENSGSLGLAIWASRRVSRVRGTPNISVASLHSRRSMARSKPIEWPMTMESPMKARRSSRMSGKVGAPMTMSSSM